MMLVKCIKGYIGLLTEGKIYEVISVSKAGYQRVKCDNGTIDGFLPAGGYLIPIDEPKENTMKIKAKFDCHFGDYKVGDVFEAQETPVSYVFKDNNGDERLRHKSEFDVVSDEPAIEVGSVWRDDEGNDHTVKFSSENTVVYGEGDWCADPENFLNLCKPKPKTVTMYFYQYGDEYTAYSEPLSVKKSAFTREIELP